MVPLKPASAQEFISRMFHDTRRKIKFYSDIIYMYVFFENTKLKVRVSVATLQYSVQPQSTCGVARLGTDPLLDGVC